MTLRTPQPAIPVPAYPRQSPLLYLNLSVFWFALSFLWAGMITMVIQQLVEHLVGDVRKPLYLGWTLGLGAFISTVVCLLVGITSDRSRWRIGKRRPYIITGSILSVPCLLWLASVHSIPLLILDFCLIQLWVNVATSPYQALIPDMVPKDHQGTASAYLGMTSLLGQLGGLILCGALLGALGLAGLWAIMLIISGLLVATMAFTVWRVPERSAAANPAPALTVTQTLIEAFRVSPRQYPGFFWLIASRFVINMGFYTATEFLLYYLKDTLHAPEPVNTATWLFVIVTFTGLLGNFPAGIISDRVSKKLVIYISAATTSVAGVIFVFTSSITVAMIAGGVFGIGFGAFMAVDWAFATNLLPDHDEAKYMGVWHIAFTVPQVVAPFIGGVVAYTFNQHVAPGFGYRAVLVLVLIYFAVGTLLIRPIRERREQPPQA